MCQPQGLLFALAVHPLFALAVHPPGSKWPPQQAPASRHMPKHRRPLRCRQNASRALSLSMVAQALLFGFYFYGMKSLYFMSSFW